MRKLLLPALLLLAPARLTAQLTGGSFSLNSISSLSGGGSASGGAFSAAALGLGGPSYSPTAPSGGSFSLAAGAAPAVVVVQSPRAGLAAAHCYPVPFRQALGHTAITFTALTREARVRIYTVSGELVRTLDKSDSGETLRWDLKNSRGEAVASGVYLFTVKSGRETATGKLMVIW